MNLKTLFVMAFSVLTFTIPTVSQACPGVTAGAPCACTAQVGMVPVTANVFTVPAAVGGGLMTYSRFVSTAPVFSAVAPVSATAVAPVGVGAYSSAGIGMGIPVGVAPVGVGTYGVGVGVGAPVGVVGGTNGFLGGGGRTKIKSKAKSKIRIR